MWGWGLAIRRGKVYSPGQEVEGCLGGLVPGRGMGETGGRCPGPATWLAGVIPGADLPAGFGPQTEAWQAWELRAQGTRGTSDTRRVFHQTWEKSALTVYHPAGRSPSRLYPEKILCSVHPAALP